MQSALIKRCEKLTWAQICLAIRDGRVPAEQASPEHFVVSVRALLDYSERERTGNQFPTVHQN